MKNVFPGAVTHPTNYYGYPTVGHGRRIKPTILAVIHTTETYSVPFPGPSKSWTFSVERDGTVHQFMDPVEAAPWTNGDIKSPDTSNPLIAAMVGSAYNPNEFCFLTIENVNQIQNGERLTDAQLDANHRIVAWASKLSGLPIERKRVIGHYQINGSTRVNCPTRPDDRDRVFDGVVTGATMPDAAMEGDMPQITKWEPGTATLDKDAKVRRSPTLAVASEWFTTTKEEHVSTFVGWVDGDAYNGSTKWGCYLVLSGPPQPTWAYTHEVNVQGVEPNVQTVEVKVEVPVPTGITQDELDAAVAAAIQTATEAEHERVAKGAGNREAARIRAI